MQRALVLASVALSFGSCLGSVGCFRFTEEPMHTVTDDAGVDATTTEVAVDAPAAETAPTMCDRYGGFATAQKAADSLLAKLEADCRVDRFFSALPADHKEHFRECVALQLGSIMRCSRDGVRVKYPNVDSKGVQCRDMRTSHATMGVHDEDFDAFIDDALAALTEQKISADDLLAIGDVLRFERADVVNPGDAGRGDACLPEGGAVDTGAAIDTGQQY